MDGTAVGEFLRSRRALLTPADVGLTTSGQRRTPGLRREEVALLAGISVDYYLRLEQGRDRNPSGAVLDSIARALCLDDDATTYLRSLALPSPRKRRARRDQVSRGVRQLLDGWTGTPAHVQNRYYDQLAANALSVALSPWHAEGENILKATFLDPGMRDYYPDWDDVTAGIVPHLRSLSAPDVDDPRLIALVGELSVRSERFRTLWARHDVRVRASGATRIRHPQVGELTLNFEKFLLPQTDGHVLVTYHADPGTASAEKLAALASLTISG